VTTFENLPGLETEFDQIEKVAVGGMAEIYRARQKSLDRAVAIKKVRPEFQQHRDILERFLREARGAGSFLHQNLAHVYDYKSFKGQSYIVMEYIDGFDLAEILDATGPLPIDVACMIATKVLLGLGYVHSHGTVHRDIKPDNVRVTVRGEVKIMDFGIAIDLSEGNLTQPGIVIGSPHYLSPEQVTGAKLDQRSDLFSFGITFYEILTGRKPFTESPKKSLFEKIRDGHYEPVQKLRPEVPSLVASVIDRCLKVDVKARANSAESLSALLQEYVHSQFGTNYEAHTRKFLMEYDFLKGNPDAVLVHEKTAEIKVERHWRQWKGFIIPAVMLLLGLWLGSFGRGWFSEARKTVDNFGSEPVQGEVQETRGVPRPTQRRGPKRPAPILPGTPVE
jgi:eukaryotic-like serine/threonine-protein kinase